MTARWRLLSPAGRQGAIAIIQIMGEAAEVEAAATALGLPPLAVGGVRLAGLLGVDEGLVARPGRGTLQLMPHGGVEIVRRLAARLGEAGLAEDLRPAPELLYPEASGGLEARMLVALAEAQSARGVDLLLAQPGRWRAWAQAGRPVEEGPDESLDRQRARLIEPPLVVAVGPANVGKSTLLNALARRSVAAVADEPGTTRDHVGVLLEVDGVAVRWIDTPGVTHGLEAHATGEHGLEARATEGAVEREAQRLARKMMERADLLVVCGDATAPPPTGLPTRERVVVALRRDLAGATFRADLAVSATRGEGLEKLAWLVRRRLVSDEALQSERPWRFWGDRFDPT